jgi:DNA-binding transcriptional regulator YiaG
VNRPADAIQAAIRRLQAAQERLAEIEAEEARLAEEKRAILAEVAGGQSESTLTPKEPYATISGMSTSFVAEPRKLGRPLSTGPVAKIAKRLGMSMVELAEAIGVNWNTLKTWNARKKIPADAQAKLDALKPIKRGAAK